MSLHRILPCRLFVTTTWATDAMHLQKYKNYFYFFTYLLKRCGKGRKNLEDKENQVPLHKHLDVVAPFYELSGHGQKLVAFQNQHLTGILVALKIGCYKQFAVC